MSDGASYLVYAEAILGDRATLLEDPWSQRVFPGYPAIMALVHLLGLSVPAAALAVNWVASGLVAVATAMLFGSARVGWGMAILTPAYLMYSTMAMSEPTLLLFTLLGLMLGERRAPVSAGLLLGFAGVVRPVACFAVIGYLTYLAVRRRWREAMAIGLLSAAIVACGVIGVKLLLGDALRSYHVQSSDHGPYEGQLLTIPFRSLLTTPLIHDVPPWKTVYTWGCVAFSLLSCFLLLRQWLHASRGKTDSGWLPLAAPWAIGNTGFTLCLGGIWGFHEFHRFMLPALPALLLAYRNRASAKASAPAPGGQPFCRPGSIRDAPSGSPTP